MTTTLKLDWPAARIEAVLAVLERPDTILLDPQRSTMWNDLDFFRGVDATIKVDWPAEWIDEFARMLEAHRRGSPHENPELVAAIQDIRGYRAAVAEVIAMTREDT